MEYEYNVFIDGKLTVENVPLEFALVLTHKAFEASKFDYYKEILIRRSHQLEGVNSVDSENKA